MKTLPYHLQKILERWIQMLMNFMRHMTDLYRTFDQPKGLISPQIERTEIFFKMHQTDL